MRLFPPVNLKDIGWCQRHAEMLNENPKGHNPGVAAALSSILAVMKILYSWEDTWESWRQSYGACYQDLKRTEQLWISAMNRAQDNLEQAQDAAHQIARLQEQLQAIHAEAATAI